MNNSQHICRPAKFAVFICALGIAQLNFAQSLTEFSAYYNASTNGISGEAERHLIHQGGNRYRLNVSLEAKVAGVQIGDLEQASEFLWTENGIQPQQYDYQVSGVSSDVESVSFNWDAGIALSAEEDRSWTIELEGQVLDQMSYQQALALAVADNPQETEFKFALVDGSEIEEHLFRLLGEEVIETPLGSLRCIKLERVREGDSGRATIIWLAADWQNLLAKIEQRNPSGMQIELSLRMALVDGELVQALTQ